MPHVRKLTKILILTLLTTGALLGVVQLVPYGRNHENPSVAAEPPWDDASTRVLAARACFDCHSNETHWPWYANVAPASWLVQRHVDEGREVLNFSDWTRAYEEAGESAETVREGSMPPWDYALMHPEAQLSAAEKSLLVSGLTATLGSGEARSDDDE